MIQVITFLKLQVNFLYLDMKYGHIIIRHHNSHRPIGILLTFAAHLFLNLWSTTVFIPRKRSLEGILFSDCPSFHQHFKVFVE